MEYSQRSSTAEREDSMHIGELAKRTECSRDTIRFYERLGLFDDLPITRSDNRYKHYDASVVERVQLIKCAKALGFTLNELGKLVHAWEKNRLSRKEKVCIFQEKIKQVDHKMAEMLQVKKYLQSKLSSL
jgi:DNA-binding transcriptional MerR regulator